MSVTCFHFACRAVSHLYLKIRPGDVWWADLTFPSQFRAAGGESNLERPGRNFLEKKNEERIARREKKNGQERDRITVEHSKQVYKCYQSSVQTSLTYLSAYAVIRVCRNTAQAATLAGCTGPHRSLSRVKDHKSFLGECCSLATQYRRE